MSARESLLALAPEEAERRVVELGGRAFHARIARRHALEDGALDYDGMTSLPKALRERLEDELPLLATREVSRTSSKDGTTKLLLELVDGKRVETVHMPSTRSPEVGATLCVSTQVGCPVGCPFCASGLLGLDRNLEAHEIIEQYVRGRNLGPLRRSVVMGIGEPLLNFENLRAALEVVHDEVGLGARKVTVSTVGFPARLRRIAPTRPPFQLAISLHTADDALRARLVPAMADVPVEEVLLAGDDWFERTGREITYEVALIAGSTATEDQARLLARRLRGRRATVNLIPWNPVQDERTAEFGRPSAEAVEAFRSILVEAGLVATVRWSRGVEAEAACGQLRLRRPAG